MNEDGTGVKSFKSNEQIKRKSTSDYIKYNDNM